jgi:hypothetical protein
MQHQADLIAAILLRGSKVVTRKLSALFLIVLGAIGIVLSIMILAVVVLSIALAIPETSGQSPDYSPLLGGTPLDAWAKAVTLDEVYSLPCVADGKGTFSQQFAFEKVVRSKMDYDHPVRTLIGKRTYLIPWGYFLFRPMPTRYNCPGFRASGIQFLIPGFDHPGYQKSYGRLYDGIEDVGDTNVVRLKGIVGYGEEHESKYAIYPRLEWWKLGPGSPGTVSEFGLWRKTVTTEPNVTTLWFSLNQMDDYLIECFQPGDVPSDFCDGDINYKDLRLRVQFFIHRGAIPQTPAIVKGIRTSLARWRDPSEIAAPRPH